MCCRHKLITVVLSDVDYDAVYCADNVVNLMMKLQPVHFLLSLGRLTLPVRTLCCILPVVMFVCRQPLHAHKTNSTSAVAVLPKQTGVWRRYLRNAHLLSCPGSQCSVGP